MLIKKKGIHLGPVVKPQDDKELKVRGMGDGCVVLFSLF